MGKSISDEKRLSRFRKVKTKLDKGNVIAVVKLLNKELKNSVLASACKDESLGLIRQNDDGTFSWVGGMITKKLVNSVYELRSEMMSKMNCYKKVKNKKTKKQSDVPEDITSQNEEIKRDLLQPELDATSQKIIDVVSALSNKVDRLSERVFNPALKKTYEQDTLRTTNRIADIQADVSFAVKRIDALSAVIKESNVS